MEPFKINQKSSIQPALFMNLSELMNLICWRLTNDKENFIYRIFKVKDKETQKLIE
jgi:hypothetical protein